jgi:hypothetical protein
MNDKNEVFGNFMTVPNCVIDNNMLYRKLLDLERELEVVKNMLMTINCPKPIYYPTQPFGYGVPDIGLGYTGVPPNTNRVYQL